MKRQGLVGSVFLSFSLLALMLGGTGCGSSSSPTSSNPSPSSTPAYSTVPVTLLTGTSSFLPVCVAYSSTSGNLWFANLSNQYLDEYTTADVSVTYIQNFDGSAVFSQIGDVKVGPDGTVYVADYGNNQVDVFTAVGSTASYATSIMSMTDSSSMAVNSAGTTLYVLESSVIGLVQIFSITGTTTKTFTPAGNFNTTTTSGVGALIRPGTMTLDSSGNVYVANFGGSNVVKYSPTGSNPVSFGSPALLKPTGIAVDSAGNVLVSQWSNPGFIQVFNPSGSGYAAGVTFGGACLDDPAGIALDGSGNLWVANQYGNQILEFKKTN